MIKEEKKEQKKTIGQSSKKTCVFECEKMNGQTTAKPPVVVWIDLHFD